MSIKQTEVRQEDLLLLLPAAAKWLTGDTYELGKIVPYAEFKKSFGRLLKRVTLPELKLHLNQSGTAIVRRKVGLDLDTLAINLTGEGYCWVSSPSAWRARMAAEKHRTVELGSSGRCTTASRRWRCTCRNSSSPTGTPTTSRAQRPPRFSGATKPWSTSWWLQRSGCTRSTHRSANAGLLLCAERTILSAFRDPEVVCATYLASECSSQHLDRQPSPVLE